MKRTIKHFAAILILAVSILSGCNANSNQKTEQIKSGEDITLYTATDLHYLSNHLNDHGEAFQTYVSEGDGKQLEYIDEILYAFIHQMTLKKPDILIISGDLTNNGEKMSHLDLVELFAEVEHNGTSVYVIPGNHDINNPWARGFKAEKQYVTESISAKEFSKLYKDYGYSEAISRDKNSLSYLAAPSEKLWLLMLDTNKYHNNQALGYPEAGGALSKNTLDWIEKCSRRAKKEGAAMITVMHHNMLHHSEVIREGFTLDNYEETLSLLKSNSINLSLSGHIHIQDIISDQAPEAPFYDIVTNALSVSPHQYGILNYSAKDGGLVYSTARTDVEGWARAKDITDDILRNFSAYSEEYFGKFAYNMAYRNLAYEEAYNEDQIKLMSETMKLLNIRYFAGIEAKNAEDVLTSEGYQLWQTLPNNRLKNYIEAIIEDKNMEDNYLEIKLNH